MSTEEKIDLSGNMVSPPAKVETTQSTIMSKLGGFPTSPGAARDWILSRRQHVRPWSEFLNSSRFQKPTSIKLLGSRAIKNLEHFMSNYVFVFLGLIVFCIITSPSLLFVIGLCGAALYYVSMRNTSQPLRVMGRDLTLSQQYTAIGVMSFPLLWLSGAGGAVFWILGASLMLIGLHAVFYKRMDESDNAFDLEMEEVITT